MADPTVRADDKLVLDHVRVQKIEQVKDKDGASHEHVTVASRDGKPIVLEDEPGLAALNKAGKLKAGDEISQYRSSDGTNSIHNTTEHATVRPDKDGHSAVTTWDAGRRPDPTVRPDDKLILDHVRVEKIEQVKDKNGVPHEHVTVAGRDGKPIVLEDEPGLAALNKAGKLKAGDEISQYRSSDGTNSIRNTTEHATVRPDKEGHNTVTSWDAAQPHHAHSTGRIATIDGHPKYSNTPLNVIGTATGVNIATDQNGTEHVTMHYDDRIGHPHVMKFESPMHAKDGSPLLDAAGKPVENPLVSMAHDMKDNNLDKVRIDFDGRGNPSDKGNLDYNLTNADKSTFISGHEGPKPAREYADLGTSSKTPAMGIA
jgi:hypothetical protein